MSSILDAESLLAIDVGSVNTRAALFDVVDGHYRLVATGRVPSTAGAPLFDISEGVRMALDQIQKITGKRLIDENESLIMPVKSDAVGVDTFVATTTTGPNVRTVLVGLMPGVSMESVRRLAAMSYLDVVEEISLMDRRRDEEQIDVILSARPDVIMVAGGTDGGAQDSILRMMETVGLAASLLPPQQQPRIIYAGNRRLVEEIIARFGRRLTIIPTANIRPNLEQEELGPARKRLTEAIAEVRSARIVGFDYLEQWSGGHFLLTADAFGRVIRYLSLIYSPEKGVLGVDLGASQVTIAAAFDGKLNVSIQADIGMGTSLTGLLERSSLEEIKRWLPIEVLDSQIRDYIFNKALYPATIPAEIEELHLEFALARQVLRSALSKARRGWESDGRVYSSVLMPQLEPIIASGAVFANAPKPEFTALMLLDAVQPTGISTFVLDPHSVTSALGVTAGPVPILTVQVLESGGYISLGTVVAPIGRSRMGRRVLRVQLEREGRAEDVVGEVRMGQLVVIPLAQGEQGRLTLRPERGIDVGFGSPGRAGTLRVTGGTVGLIIDARGRPLELPKDAGHRRELNQKWLWDIGAME
ncbi:MAG: hypothetical protein GTO14_16745 [Anaerolineales bacterium]|nr:hypothetical protein [Anaerolineales bacterium]